MVKVYDTQGLFGMRAKLHSMRTGRKFIWIGLVFFFLLSRVAHAESLSGDFYFGLRISPTFTATAQVPFPPQTIPFRGKFYYQDGLYRIDLDIPSLTPTTARAGKGSTASVGSFSVFTILLAGSNKATFIDHKLRRAYQVELPITPTFQFSEENLRQVLARARSQEGLGLNLVKVGQLKKMKPTNYEGLTALGNEFLLSFSIPEEAKAFFPPNLKPVVSARILYEKQTRIPLSLELETDVASVVLALKNVSAQKMPDILFQIPELYVVQELSMQELGNILEEFGRNLEDILRESVTKIATPPEVPPKEEESVEGSVEEKAPEEVTGEQPGESVPEKPKPGTTVI